MDAVLSSADPAWPQHVTRSTIVDASCRSCGKLLGHLTWMTVNTHFSGSVPISWGLRGIADATLEPGFTNAETHHPSGVKHWYVRATVKVQHPDAAELPSPDLRLPAVVTCECGVDNRLAKWNQEQVLQLDRPFLSPKR
jgi:hypothetical protein